MHKQTLYSLRHSTDNNFTITKFVDGEVESSYELAANLRECACPAGHRPSCRHRQMAPMMLASGIIDSHWFWDFDLNRAVDFSGNLKSNFDAMQELAAEKEPESDLARWDRIINRPHELRKPLANIPGISVHTLDNPVDLHNAIAEAVGEAQHTEARQTFTIPDGYEAVRDSDGRATGEIRPVGEVQHTEVEQLPPGDYTAEVGEIKTFDDGVVMMQMKNIKPWRRL